MKKILCLSGLLALWLGAPLCAGAQPSNLILLRNVNVATAPDSTRIELKFNRVPGAEGITYQGDFVQIELPDTYVDPPKQWISTGDSIIKNIFLYQWSDTTVRMRLYPIGKGEDLKDKIRLSKEGKKIFIQYDIPSENEMSTMPGLAKEHENNPPLSPFMKGGDSFSPPFIKGGKGGFDQGFSGETSLNPGITKDAENTLPLANPAVSEPQAAGRSENQEPPAPQPSPDIKLTQSKPADQKMPVGGGVPNLYASLLKMVAALGVLIALLFAALYLIKRVFGKKMGIAGQDQSIRVITNAYLGPKKTIALVDIAGERIVVGITQDHISMLTKLGQNREFKEILQEQTSADEKVELKDELWEKV